jgi:hypothetical protein
MGGEVTPLFLLIGGFPGSGGKDAVWFALQHGKFLVTLHERPVCVLGVLARWLEQFLGFGRPGTRIARWMSVRPMDKAKGSVGSSVGVSGS